MDKGIIKLKKLTRNSQMNEQGVGIELSSWKHASHTDSQESDNDDDSKMSSLFSKSSKRKNVPFTNQLFIESRKSSEVPSGTEIASQNVAKTKSNKKQKIKQRQ